MKLTELLATREQELLQEIESLEKVEQSLKECRDELEALKKAQEVCLDNGDLSSPKTPLLPQASVNPASVDVSDLLLLKHDFDAKFASLPN